MFLKLAIIGGILVVGGLIFSSDIIELFPNTSTSVVESFKNDVNSLGTKTLESVENRIDTSIEKVTDGTSQRINDIKKSSEDLASNEIAKINPSETIGNFFDENLNQFK